MKSYLFTLLIFFSLLTVTGCKKENQRIGFIATSSENTIQYAKGLEIYPYKGYSIVKVTHPWPDAAKTYTYILQQKNGRIPDSLKQLTVIQVPVKSVVVTATTHIPPLEMLGVENTLTGFPFTDYISSEKTRARIDTGKVQEVGTYESLNTEVLIDLAPDIIIGHAISNHDPVLDYLEKSGLQIILNGEWNEQTPLGKAEWIKFFGALYDKDQQAAALFDTIKAAYTATQKLTEKTTAKPTVFSGALYKDQWYLPEGKSWFATFIKDAHASYLWSETTGTGSLSASFETVLERAEKAAFWIGITPFNSLNEMAKSNPHYAQFSAFKNKKVYSCTAKKGATGGILYFELSPYRPDLVLKDMIRIFHPELLPDYKLFFFQKLK